MFLMLASISASVLFRMAFLLWWFSKLFLRERCELLGFWLGEVMLAEAVWVDFFIAILKARLFWASFSFSSLSGGTKTELDGLEKPELN